MTDFLIYDINIANKISKDARRFNMVFERRLKINKLLGEKRPNENKRLL